MPKNKRSEEITKDFRLGKCERCENGVSSPTSRYCPKCRKDVLAEARTAGHLVSKWAPKLRDVMSPGLIVVDEKIREAFMAKMRLEETGSTN